MRKYINKLERVQRRATRLTSEISQLSYEERLQQCRLVHSQWSNSRVSSTINMGSPFSSRMVSAT